MGYTIEIPTSDFRNLLDRIFLATPLYLITLDLSQQTYKHPIVILILQYLYQESSLIKRNVISTNVYVDSCRVYVRMDVPMMLYYVVYCVGRVEIQIEI